MNREEAKLLLQSYRPNEQDREDTTFREALALLERDPQLKEWFERQQAFDAAMASHLQAIPIPAQLKRNILAQPKPPAFWPASRQAWALAAAMLLLLAIAGGTWWHSRPPTFAAFCSDVTEQSWNHAPHLEFVSKDLRQIRGWLADNQAANDFHVPASLAKARVRGCNIVHYRGQKVPVLCLLEEGKHMHLIISDTVTFADGPGENQPELIDVGQIRTAGWKHKDTTYVLNSLERKKFMENFVKRFRHSGQWNLTI
jgi:hypothetical protein